MPPCCRWRDRVHPGILWVGTEQRGLCRRRAPGPVGPLLHPPEQRDPRQHGLRILTTGAGAYDEHQARPGLLRPGQRRVQDFRPGARLQSSEFNARAFALASTARCCSGIGGLTSFFPDGSRTIPSRRRSSSRPCAPWTAKQPRRRPRRSIDEVCRSARPRSIRRRDLTFEYVALHYSDPSNNRYSTGWTATTPTGRAVTGGASLHEPHAGRYTFG